MPYPLAPEKVALIRALAAKGFDVGEIAQQAGVHQETVRRYLRGDRMLPEEYPPARRHEASKPLFDPVRDGVPDMTLTAQLCGDPAPGRRELVAHHASTLERGNVVTMLPNRPRPAH